MNPERVYHSIQQNLPKLFGYAQLSDTDVRVRTPLLYPDGGLIDVFVYEQDGRLTVTDYGEALGWLGLQSASNIQTPRRKKLINDICMTLGIEFENEQLQFACERIAELGEAVHRLAQAIVRVSDICFTFPQPLGAESKDTVQHPETVKTEITKWLDERSFTFKEEVKHNGKSGAYWTIDYEIVTASFNHLVFYLNSNTRKEAIYRVCQVFAGCSDLSNNENPSLLGTADMPPIALFDDAGDIWEPEHYKLIEPVSRLVRWSQPAEFERALKAA